MNALTQLFQSDAAYGIGELPVAITFKGVVGLGAKTPRIDVLGMMDAGFEQKFDFDITCTIGTWPTMPVTNDIVYMPDDATGAAVSYSIHKTDWSPDGVVVTYGVKQNV